MDITRQEVIEQLDQHVKGIPEKTILTGSQPAPFSIVGLCILSFATSGLMLYRYLTQTTPIAAAILFSWVGIFFLILSFRTWTNAQTKIIKLTHQEIWIKGLNTAIPLEHIVDFHYSHEMNQSITLKIRQTTPALALTTKADRLKGASVAIVNKIYPEVVIMVPKHFMLNKHALSAEQVTQIFSTYLDIPHIKKQLMMF